MKKMNVRLLSFMVLFISILTLTACQTKQKDGNDNKEVANTNQSNESKDMVKEDTKNTDQGADNTNTESKVLEGIITITGSTSVEKIVLDMADEFVAYNPEVQINYVGTGSSAGIEDAILGVNDLGASSRQVKDSELEQGLETIVFAYDGIALVTHPSNPVINLTKEQVLKIYSGEIKNWKEVGGNDATIIVISREGASGTRGAFEELIGLKDVGLTESATIVEGNGNVQTAVSGNVNAIGYVSFSFINDTVKALTIDGGIANADEVKKEAYPLSRPFLFAYKEDKLSEVTKAFLEYVVTSEAQAAVEKHGGIRID